MSTGFCAAPAKRMVFIYSLFMFGGLISEIAHPAIHHEFAAKAECRFVGARKASNHPCPPVCVDTDSGNPIRRQKPAKRGSSRRLSNVGELRKASQGLRCS